MKRFATVVWACAALPFCFVSEAAEGPPVRTVTTGTLLQEMTDFARLARWPEPAYRTIQFSSYDRRSKTSDAPGWFANADGFGGEPIPAFQKVLRAPQGDTPGLYLMAEVSGPGAIVRGWSAGMAGVLRVYLDPGTNGTGKLIWEGPAYDFLARRAAHYLKLAGLYLEARDALSQEDADYLPIPFAHGLRVTWEGKLNELHFYHLQVRLYPPGTVVRTFDPKEDFKAAQQQLWTTVAALLEPASRDGGEPVRLEGTVEPGRAWTWSPESKEPGAVRELTLRLEADEVDTALRGCLLRIWFDGSQRPQVEAPVGDFFGSGPGINPFSSMPFSVKTNGTFTCRFVMPYEKSLRVEIVNYTKATARVSGSVRLSPWSWNDRSLYFRAKWRVDHDLLAGAQQIDLPYLLETGKGVFVGCAAMIMNPSGVPTAGGNWWGEGDEKILVDGEPSPSTFGTGSEDYFNYSWSRPDLFAHPFCGQPLDSGPDTAGYVSNHRFQIMDAIPFEKSLAVLMELWVHNRTPGLSYARIAYHYSRPNAIDDHRGLMPSDLRIPPLPKREPKALGGATGARFYFADQLHPEPTSGRMENVPCPVATQLQVALWSPAKGDRLRLTFSAEKTAKTALHLVALHRPDGASIRALLNGQALATDAGEEVQLRSAFAPRVLNVNFKPVDLTAGENELVLECVEPGPAGIDFLWVKTE
jgi:hypothetical protein